jgi:hypothetical protein
MKKIAILRMRKVLGGAPSLASELADLVCNLVQALFDTYRPELHYMRGPGPKWRAKHERTLGLGRDVAALRRVAFAHARFRPVTSNSHSRAPRLVSVAKHAACLVLGIALLVIAFLFASPTASKADASNCAQVSDLAAARLRWAAARQSRVDAAQDEKKCRAYRIHFYDAVTARQAASLCEDGIHRQQDLALLDVEIDAFNNLVAAQCGG